jgi:AraC family transcriptional regulator of adaptative response/methylated-DNA-[protein]-cysteine methyltransferase
VRVFRAHLGITPSAYRRRVMAERARATLAGSRSVLDAAEGAGFGAPSRFYASVGAELGMAAARARRGGEGERVTWVTRPCSLGRVLVAWTARGACHVGLGGRDEGLVRELRSRFPRADVTPGDAPPWLELLLAAVDGAAGAARGIPLDVHGTAFQERVWRALARISPGETRSYEEIAASLGAPHGARAVARACATNGLAVLVPCHRVVRKGGALAGYRWGLARKRALLARERAAQEDGAPLPLRTGTASPRVRARGTDRA